MGALVWLHYGVSGCQRQNAETTMVVCHKNKVNQFAGLHQGKCIIFLTMKGDLRGIPSVLGGNLQFSGTFSPREIRTVDHLPFSYERGHLGYHTAKHN